MATLQKFKILATQCGVTQSPTRSPRTSPLVHLPRKKTTLRMLLTRNTTRQSTKQLTSQQGVVVDLDYDLPEKKKIQRDRDLVGQSHTLKDLFVSSFEDENINSDKFGEDDKVRDKTEVLLTRKLQGLGGEPGLSRPVWVGFRHRLLRKAWRPMLETIPE